MKYATTRNYNRNIHRHLINRELYNLNAVDCYNNTPLMLAALCNHNLEVIKIFIDEYKCNPMDINGDGNTVFHIAVIKNSNTAVLD
jgi:ankyrin repeat protein